MYFFRKEEILVGFLKVLVRLVFFLGWLRRFLGGWIVILEVCFLILKDFRVFFGIYRLKLVFFVMKEI